MSSPHSEEPRFLLTESHMADFSQSQPGDMRGAGGRLEWGEEHSPQSVQPASHRPRPLPSARPRHPPGATFPSRENPGPKKTHLTQEPINLVPKRHSHSAEAGTPLVIRTRGKEGKCSRKRNKTEISSVLERTACWVTPP